MQFENRQSLPIYHDSPSNQGRKNGSKLFLIPNRQKSKRPLLHVNAPHYGRQQAVVVARCGFGSELLNKPWGHQPQRNAAPHGASKSIPILVDKATVNAGLLFAFVHFTRSSFPRPANS